MALSFSFPSGKKKGQSFLSNSGESGATDNNLRSHLSNGGDKGPKSWKSFPSLAFFKESTTSIKPVPISTSNSKLPVRTLAAAAFTPQNRSQDQSSIGSKLKELVFDKGNTNEDGTRKSLPDVADTESPKPLSSYPPDKPCDLLAQIQSLSLEDTCGVGGNSESLTQKRQNEPESSQMEKDVNRSFDDNGNPYTSRGNADGQADKLRESQEKVSSEQSECDKGDECGSSSANAQSVNAEVADCSGDEPKYFINAAELSEEDTYLQSILPIEDTKSTTTMSTDKTEKLQESPSEPKNISPLSTTTIQPSTSSMRKNSEIIKGISVIRPRVRVSKSYPDIIQTTFNSEEQDSSIFGRPMAKENSDLDSLVADSLENLAPKESDINLERNSKQGPNPNIKSTSNTTTTEDKPFKAFEKPSSGVGIMSSSALMTESQIGGLFAEKPPEAWVIDLNSLSVDSDLESSKRSHNSGSNSNSLAFFVNIDDKEELQSERRNSGASSASAGTEKKIFSMFVDIRDRIGQGDSSSGIPKSTKHHPHIHHTNSINLPSSMNKNVKNPVINKPVMNIMETSTGSLKSSKRFPSPIFQHKAAAEAARQAARKEWEKQREKYFDSLEPTSMMIGMGLPEGLSMTMEEKGAMGESTLSNRSSLHVANVLESSFSSSLISSMETSQPTEMELCQGGPCFKLGKDLIRMFQDGINTDVNISVSGKWIKAHKCILASRSQYFAAILSGHWVEKAGNTINLDGFSYSVVQFALYHIYSGTNEIPETIDLLELATLTDLLGLEGLRENISQTFRVKFCHNFHRPCTGCITGVLECFPIAITYGMDDLSRKITKWICKHFVRIWPTKGFASLGDELIEKCLRYSVNHLSVDNILDHTLGCDQLQTTMPTLRWTEPIFQMVNQLAEECIQFVGENLSEVLQNQKFLQFGKGQAWNISRIEGTFMQAMTLLKPDVACLSHTALTRLIELGTETIDEVEWSTSFVDFLKMLRDEVEKYLLANASKAVLSKCWEELSQATRKKICSTSFVGYDKFGNKIVKNTGATGNMTAAKAPPKEKTSSQRSTGGGPSTGPSSKKASSVVKPTQSSTATTPTTAKVASVRPMQSHSQQYNNSDEPQPIPIQPSAVTPTQPPKRSVVNPVSVRMLSNEFRTSSAKSSGNTTESDYHRSTTSRNINKTMSTDRDKSSNSRRTSVSTSSPTASANRTPSKPLTPSIPSKPSPLTGYDNELTGRRTNSGKSRNSARQQPKAPEPPKKTFLTNSAKAAAVSKPILRPVSKKTPSSSVSSLSSQGGQNSTTTTTSGPNTTQSQRYLSARQNSSDKFGTFSARSSFSNVERPQTTPRSKVDSNPPRRNTYGQSQTQRNPTNPRIPSTNTTTANKAKRPVSSSSATSATRSGARQSSTFSGHSSMPPVNANASTDFQSLNDSYSRDSLMSRSTIETESGEIKMRTLAEIGRSSTFSKDEPTILGKLDGSTYGQIDYDEYE